MRLALLLALASGCAVAGRPPIALDVVGDDDFAAGVELGCNAWSKLGYVAHVGPKRAGDLVVRVVQTPDLQHMQRGGESGGLLGYTTGDLIEIDAAMRGDYLRHVAAHELGHVLFGPDHLTDRGSVGIMHYLAQWQLEPTPEDYALACREAGDCLTE